MRKRELARVADILVGDWTLSITNQRWLDDPTTATPSVAKGEWLGDAFVQLRAWFTADSDEIFGPSAPAQSDDLDQAALHFVFGPRFTSANADGARGATEAVVANWETSCERERSRI